MKATPKKSFSKDHRAKLHSRGDQKKADSKLGKHRQVGALPFRTTVSGDVEILLITSRQTGRFTIPNGSPMKRLRDPAAAAKEAYEEAGVGGKVRRKPIGNYIYWKRLERSFELLKVDVYALEVRGQRQDWPERTSRRYGWLPRRTPRCWSTNLNSCRFC